MSGESLLVILLVGVIAGWLVSNRARTVLALSATSSSGYRRLDWELGCCAARYPAWRRIIALIAKPPSALSCCCSSVRLVRGGSYWRAAGGAVVGAVGAVVVIRARGDFAATPVAK